MKVSWFFFIQYILSEDGQNKWKIVIFAGNLYLFINNSVAIELGIYIYIYISYS